jgi:UDP-N-acetylmuramoyl-L-alanyl-D-glutamate--2,6-diaminopimelate ligase
MKFNKLIQNTDDFKIISFIGNSSDKNICRDAGNANINIDEYKDLDIDIKGISNDSRNISEGYLFAARKGNSINSNKYIKDAAEKGASSILTDEQIDGALESYINEYNKNALNRGKNGISVIIVDDALKAYAVISRNFFNRPAMKLKMAGITGTNGKTTTSYLLNSILNTAGLFSGLIGTIDYKIAFTDKDNGIDIPSVNTTPDSYMLNDMLNTMILNNLKSCVMEVSSHSLIQRRTYGIDFDIAIFTNLTRDHLDYHKDMESYYQAKKLLFTEVLSKSLKNKKYAVINNDDEYGARLISELSEPESLNNFNVITYGLTEKADVFAKDIKSTTKGLEFKLYYNNLINKMNYNLKTPAPDVKFFIVKSSLMGSFNVYNMLAAATSAFALSVDNENISKGISALTSVPGRVEKIRININSNNADSGSDSDNGGNDGNSSSVNGHKNGICTLDSNNEAIPLVCVDYAHTDDALNRVLSALRDITSNNLICVFGCGGDRDKGKRPMMGRHAGRLADITVITSDNPRSENPMSIIKEIENGIKEENVFFISCDGSIGDINRLKNEIRRLNIDKDNNNSKYVHKHNTDKGKDNRSIQGTEYAGDDIDIIDDHKLVHIYTIVPDREKAIKTALSIACSEKDTVLISGKGHEDYMIIGANKTHFSDKEEVLKFYNL